MKCWLLALTITVVGCSKARPIAIDSRGLTWQHDIGPLFAARCVSCHAGANAGGGYALDSYLGALGDGTHASPDAVAGDANSVLVEMLDPARADAVHRPVSDVFPTVRQWVVSDALAYVNSPFHAGGILNPADPAFHGQLLRANNWSFSLCASCHGADFSGGTAQVSCNGCHAAGVTACVTCHGRYGQSGSHAAHVAGGDLQKKLDCSECHIKPAAYTDVGHLFDAQGNVLTGPAPVVFGALASTPTSARRGPPSWTPTSQSCSNVYCHGDAFADTRATLTQPRFDLPGTGQARCGTCHGLPPSSHASWQTQCSLCHGGVVDANQHFLNPVLHINGAVDLGDDSGGCSACHGDATSSAPPRDLSGNTDPSAIGVGAHRAHVQGLHQLRGPIPCQDCHALTPKALYDPGHIDSPPPAKVFPGGAAFPGLAAADGALPVWARASATCSGSYCHGGGEHLADDASLGLSRVPSWTSTVPGQAACGTCHGVPPLDGAPGHAAGAPLTSCAGCHAKTMDPSGAILITFDGGVATSAHINGVIDAP